MKKEKCRVCHGQIKVMAYMGTGVCSMLCEKVDKGEITLDESIAQGGRKPPRPRAGSNKGTAVRADKKVPAKQPNKQASSKRGTTTASAKNGAKPVRTSARR